jgi:hypothetical protein
MNEFWTKLIDWIKQPPRVVAAIALACAIILFSPSRVQDAVHVTSILNTIGPYIGIVFILACTLLITSVISFSYSWCQKQILCLRVKRLRVQSLSDLTPIEKQILRYYILKSTKTQKLPLESGVVAGLVAKQIISRATMFSREGTDFDYNIQPWAWSHLNENRNLIEE